jgi:hypothetical protein
LAHVYRPTWRISAIAASAALPILSSIESGSLFEVAVMANALEAVGQNVEQKAADEFGRCKRHKLDERTVATTLCVSNCPLDRGTAWMGKPYSEDLRRGIVHAIEAGHIYEEAAELAGVSISSVSRISGRLRSSSRRPPFA